MIIKLELRGQKLIADAPFLAERTINKLFCEIKADSEWDGLTIRLVFRSVDALGQIARSVVVTDYASVPVPPECIRRGYLFISAIGIADGGDTRLTTGDMPTALKINAVSALDAPTGNPVLPDEYDQLLAILGNLASVPAQDTTSVSVILNFLFAQIGSMSKLDTENKNSIVNAINEVLQVSKSAKIPIARGQSDDGTDFIAHGELPTVALKGDGPHIGKGTQIVFIPERSNLDQPVLSINSGEAIEIRMRAVGNSDGSAADLTKELSTGMLRQGVPYTMTFCGKYWLIDSYIPISAYAAGEAESELMRDFFAAGMDIADADTVGIPCINSMDDMDGGKKVGKALIEREDNEETEDPHIVRLPSVGRVRGMIGEQAPRVFHVGEDLTEAKDGDFLLDDEDGEGETEVDDDELITFVEMEKYFDSKKQELAQLAANLVDTAMLELIGSGEVTT